MASTGDFSKDQQPTKRTKCRLKPIAFDDEDLEGTIQPHDDALVIVARISGFLVKRVMIDQGSGANVMYPNLFRGLGLKNQDLAKYDSPLVSFDGRVVIPQGQISLPVSMEGKEVTVTFIVVNSFSPYMVILGRPWIHAMGAIPSTLYEIQVPHGMRRCYRKREPENCSAMSRYGRPLEGRINRPEGNY